MLLQAIKMVQQHGHRRPDPRDIFGRLSQLIASCIMLDSVRHEIRGGTFLSFEKQDILMIFRDR